MIVGGIDPGKSGALVVIDGWHISRPMGLMIRRVPISKATKKKEKDHVNWDIMAEDWGRALRFCDHVFIEHVWGARVEGRQQGGTSMFNFGYVAGFAFGLVKAYDKQYTFITPQKWKKLVGLKGSDKGQSRALAAKLLPDYASEFKRVKDDGVAEAALIAYSGGASLINPATKKLERPDKEEWEV